MKTLHILDVTDDHHIDTWMSDCGYELFYNCPTSRMYIKVGSKLDTVLLRQGETAAYDEAEGVVNVQPGPEGNEPLAY